MCHLADVISGTGFYVFYELNHTFMYLIILLAGRNPPFGGCDGTPYRAEYSYTVVVDLEKVGGLNGKGFNRGTLWNGALRGSDKGPKYSARPKHRSSSAPFKRHYGEIPDRSREFFLGGFRCLSGTDRFARSDVTR